MNIWQGLSPRVLKAIIGVRNDRESATGSDFPR